MGGFKGKAIITMARDADKPAIGCLTHSLASTSNSDPSRSAAAMAISVITLPWQARLLYIFKRWHRESPVPASWRKSITAVSAAPVWFHSGIAMVATNPIAQERPCPTSPPKARPIWATLN